MSKFKFYQIHDSKKESLSIFTSQTLTEAYIIASNLKKLPLEDFKKLFKVEKIK
tara:strand:+ start:1297 stop:1458 length:162 start_codon:yes stop_codon:yes gene_type:complete